MQPGGGNNVLLLAYCLCGRGLYLYCLVCINCPQFIKTKKHCGAHLIGASPDATPVIFMLVRLTDLIQHNVHAHY